MASSIENRLRRLEPIEPPSPRQTCRVIVEVGESVDEAIQRQFGEAGLPEGANLIIRQLVEPEPWPEPPEPPEPDEQELPRMNELEMLARATRRGRFG